MEIQDNGTKILDRPDLLDLTGNTGEFVRITINSDYGGDGYTGLGAVKIFAPAFIPEPASLTLLGLGATVLAARRRSR